MKRSILPRVIALGVLVLALAGCVRFQAAVTLTPDNTVNGEIVVAVLLPDDTTESRTTAQAGTTQIATSLLGTLTSAPGVSTSDYEQDGYLGTRIKLTNVALSAFNSQEAGALKFTREGDEFVFSGTIDFSSESAGGGTDENADDSNLTVSVTFPGAVTDHNGELSGTTVSWKTPIDKRLEMSARGGANAAGPGILLFVIIGVVVVVLAAAVVAVLLLLRSRRNRAAVVSASPPPPPPPVTDAVTPMAAEPAKTDTPATPAVSAIPPIPATIAPAAAPTQAAAPAKTPKTPKPPKTTD
ncbi:MAG: hypothetical protein ABIR17_05475 [Pseudolysinimonas sp.]|uniref:LppM family (lipo)protein n=1 Tax=Pseudolysinimonas sp. TaxID=2680009 RepID=UPI003263C321